MNDFDLRRDRHVAEEINAELIRAGLDDLDDKNTASSTSRLADALADFPEQDHNAPEPDRLACPIQCSPGQDRGHR